MNKVNVAFNFLTQRYFVPTKEQIEDWEMGITGDEGFIFTFRVDYDSVDDFLDCVSWERESKKRSDEQHDEMEVIADYLKRRLPEDLSGFKGKVEVVYDNYGRHWKVSVKPQGANDQGFSVMAIAEFDRSTGVMPAAESYRTYIDLLPTDLCIITPVDQRQPVYTGIKLPITGKENEYKLKILGDMMCNCIKSLEWKLDDSFTKAKNDYKEARAHQRELIAERLRELMENEGYAHFSVQSRCGDKVDPNNNQERRYGWIVLPKHDLTNWQWISIVYRENVADENKPEPVMDVCLQAPNFDEDSCSRHVVFDRICLIDGGRGNDGFVNPIDEGEFRATGDYEDTGLELPFDENKMCTLENRVRNRLRDWCRRNSIDPKTGEKEDELTF
ncbi:MAG: hypothetical protein Q4C41_08000 [Eggerthellaceae bacterium]|nr:hypothetical protein [Eggerthellaceae bacterium]